MVDKSNREARKLRPHGPWYSLIGAALLLLVAASPARCQGVPDVHVITNNTPVLLAQSAPAPTPGVLPTDATKGNFLQDQASRSLSWFSAKAWAEIAYQVVDTEIN